MFNWFGSLDLAMKYVVVFGSLLVLTIIAGFIKLIFIKRRIKKHVAAAREATKNKPPAEEDVEKNTPTKDEGDLFGVRAIESGFFGGVAQSRPGSPASSRAPSISGRPVSPVGSFSGNHNPGPSNLSTSSLGNDSRGGSSSNLLSPKNVSKPPPGPIRLPTNNSAISLPMRSPLSQHPFNADHISPADGDKVDSPTLPLSAKLRDDASRPHFSTASSYASQPTGYQRLEPSTPTSISSHAPQLDLPKRGFSPLESDPTKTPSTHVPQGNRNRSFSRPLSFKSHRASKNLTAENVPVPSGPSQTFYNGDSTQRNGPDSTAGPWGANPYAEGDKATNQSRSISTSLESSRSKDPFMESDARSSRSSSTGSMYSNYHATKPRPAPSNLTLRADTVPGAIGTPVRSHFELDGRERSGQTPTRSHFELDGRDRFSRNQMAPPPRSRSPVHAYTPDIELSSFGEGHGFPKPPMMSHAPAGRIGQQPIRSARSPVRSSGSVPAIQAPTPIAPPQTLAPKKNPALRLTTDALSDLYDSYWRRPSDDLTNHLSEEPDAMTDDSVSTTGSPPRQKPSILASTIHSARLPPPPPSPGSPPPPPHGRSSISSSSPRVVESPYGFHPKGMSAELVNGDESESQRELHTLGRQGMNPRLMAHTRGMSKDQNMGPVRMPKMVTF